MSEGERRVRRSGVRVIRPITGARPYAISVNFEFSGEIWSWRGPSPFHFVTVPDRQSEEIKDISGFVTYGWGMIPVKVRIGRTEWKTALWPKDGRYIVPIKDVVRKAEKLDLGDIVTIRLEVSRGAR